MQLMRFYTVKVSELTEVSIVHKGVKIINKYMRNK